MTDRGENQGIAMDLSLNLSPASPVVIGLELGSGLGFSAVPHNNEISIRRVRSASDCARGFSC